MFYHSGVIIAPSLKTGTFAGHLSDKKSSLDKFPSSASLRRSTARLRKVRWTIYKKIGSNERDVRRSLGNYKSLVIKFIKRFSVKLKLKEPIIWKEKLDKTSKDVENFLSKKPKFNSTYKVNSLVHAKSESRIKVGGVFDASGKLKKKKKTAKKAKDEKLNTTKTCDKCEACASTNYVVNLDAVMVLLFTLLNLVKVDPDENNQYKPDFSKTPITEQILTTAQGVAVNDDQFDVPIYDWGEDDFSEAPITEHEQIFDDEIDATARVNETPEDKITSDSTEAPPDAKDPVSTSLTQRCLQEIAKQKEKKDCGSIFLNKRYYYRKCMKVAEERELKFSQPFKMMSIINEFKWNKIAWPKGKIAAGTWSVWLEKFPTWRCQSEKLTCEAKTCFGRSDKT